MSGKKNLLEAFKAVRDVVHWQFLGLELGISYNGLANIMASYRGMKDSTQVCLLRCLEMWLEQDRSAICIMCVPSWSILKEALKNIGENELADNIQTDGEFDCLNVTVLYIIHAHNWGEPECAPD